MWAFGISPYGLALNEERLWSYTPREFDELRHVFENHRRHTEVLYADLQATLHNAWFRGKEHPSAFKREDFISTPKTAKEPQTDWRTQRAVLGGIFAAQKQKSECLTTPRT